MQHRTRSLALAAVGLLAMSPIFTVAEASSSLSEVVGGPVAISAEQAVADIDLADQTLATLHAGYDRYASGDDLAAAFEALRGRSAGGTTDEALYLGLSEVLAMIRCDHTKAEYPERLREFRETVPTYLPVRTHVFGDKVYAGVNRVEGLERGDTIVAINGIDTRELLERIVPLIPFDGATSHVRYKEFEFSSEFMGPALDVFMPLIYGWSDTLEIRVSRGGEERTVRAEPLTHRELVTMVRNDSGRSADFVDGVSVEVLNRSTALLTVDTFVNYRRPVDAMTVYADAIRPLNEAGVGHLIVDLRGCGGGSNDAAIGLARHVIKTPLQSQDVSEVRTVPIPESLRPHLQTWDESIFAATQEMFDRQPSGAWRMKGGGPMVLPPAPDHFRGRVTLLSGPANASGATMAISELQQRGGLEVVGTPTGGSVAGCTAGIIVFLELPNSGIRVRVPLIRTITGLEPATPGMGVTPDVVVTTSADDFFAGRDPVLDAARGR